MSNGLPHRAREACSELGRSLQTALDFVAEAKGLLDLLGAVTVINHAGGYVYRVTRSANGVRVQIALPETPLGRDILKEEARLFPGDLSPHAA